MSTMVVGFSEAPLQQTYTARMLHEAAGIPVFLRTRYCKKLWSPTSGAPLLEALKGGPTQ